MSVKVLFVLGPEFEDLEALYPYYRLKEEGFEPVVAAKERGKVTGKHGYTLDAQLSFSEVNPKDYVALVIPGGRSPEHIRTIPEVKTVVKAFFEENKPVAAICHGPQVLISAGLVRGKTLTSYYSVADDLIAAGANYKNEPLVVDGNLISSRQPSDLPYFVKGLLEALKAKTVSVKVKR
jgi:protease I